MSRDARAWVRSRSPLTGGEYAVHLTMADTVDDGCVLRIDQGRLAEESRVSRSTVTRAVARMLALGLLEHVDTPEQQKVRKACHRPVRLRMLFPALRVVVSPSHHDAANQDNSIGHCDAAASSPSHHDAAVPNSPSRGDAAAIVSPSHHDAAKEQELEKQQDLPLQQELPPAPPESKATIHLFPVPPLEPTVPAGPEALARLILNDWWERQHPKPQQTYISILKVMIKALKSGWEERDLREALDSVPTMSGPALDFWRSRNRNGKGARRPQYGTGSKPASELAEQAVDRIADLLGYSQ